jgi:two-component system chemotaxis response regulator CheB
LFTAQFAERLNATCRFAVKEAAHGDEVMMGRVLIAPGDFHMRVVRTHMGMRVQLDQGARGLLAMREAGSRTIVQDEASCVVFGMPREAIRCGAAESTLPLDGIARAIALGQVSR